MQRACLGGQVHFSISLQCICSCNLLLRLTPSLLAEAWTVCACMLLAQAAVLCWRLCMYTTLSA